jgi:hypothetical protein
MSSVEGGRSEFKLSEGNLIFGAFTLFFKTFKFSDFSEKFSGEFSEDASCW